MRWRWLSIWLLALVVTLAAAWWQRRSGPSHPARGAVELAGERIEYRLPRSHVTGSGQPVGVRVSAPETTGEIVWRRYPTRDEWIVEPLVRAGDRLGAELPSQPPAGKLEYQVRLRHGATEVLLPPTPAVTRFRGAVPAGVLVPHIAAMFLGLLCGNAAALAAAAGEPAAKRLARATLGLLTVGGLALGPLVQKHAFDAYWTGFPFGHDLTDNKTAIAVLAWALALLATRRGRPGRAAIVAAALLTLAVFALPHSLFGSELRWDDAGPAAR